MPKENDFAVRGRHSAAAAALQRIAYAAPQTKPALPVLPTLCGTQVQMGLSLCCNRHIQEVHHKYIKAYRGKNCCERGSIAVKIEHLIYITEIAKRRSISLAAKQLYIGQTTLSAIVKSIEDELDIQIFQRTYSGVIATQEGEKVLGLAKKIIDLYGEMTEIEREASVREQTVHILASTSANSNLSVFLTQQMQIRSPQSALIFHEPMRTKMLASMFEGIANLAIGHWESSELKQAEQIARTNGITMELLYSDSFYLCVSAHSKYADRESVDIAELADERQVTPHYYFTNSVNSVFAQAFRSVPRVASFTSNELVKLSVLNSNLIAFLAGINFIRDENAASGALRVIPLTGLAEKNEVGVYALYRESELTKPEQCALEIAREFFRAGIPRRQTGSPLIL